MDSVQRQVEVGLVVLLSHSGYIKVKALCCDLFELRLQGFEYLQKFLVFEDVPGSEQTDVQSLWSVEIGIVVIENVHLFQFARNYDLLLEHLPHELIDQIIQLINYRL